MTVQRPSMLRSAAELPRAISPTDCARCHPSWRLVLGRNVCADRGLLRTFVLSPTDLNLYIRH